MLCSVCELDLRSSKSMDIEAMRSMSQGGRVHGARVGKDVTDTHTHDSRYTLSHVALPHMDRG